ncbi:MAG: hypothetical protein JWO95_1990 [Verrucomicrobiales bacterium]|nr:hypothetical protein [Verrucomicrobiales bacterium]
MNLLSPALSSLREEREKTPYPFLAVTSLLVQLSGA